MFDANKVKNECVNWIREFFSQNGSDCNAVVGISGGKDSSVAAALCVEALGRDRVIGVLMPQGEQHDIDKAYMLEVSSPGIERDLKRREHYDWAIGETVEIKLYAPVNGTKTVKGELVSFDDANLTVSIKGAESSIERKNVSKAKTVFDFGSNK